MKKLLLLGILFFPAMSYAVQYKYIQVPGSGSASLQPGTTIGFYVSSGTSLSLNAATFTAYGKLSGKGTTSADTPTTGFIGEYTSSANVAGITNVPTSNQYGDLAVLSLSPGDWDLYGSVYFEANGAAWTSVIGGIGTVTGNDSTGVSLGDTGFIYNVSATTNTIVSIPLIFSMVNINTTTSYYLKFRATYSVGQPIARGILRARRRR